MRRAGSMLVVTVLLATAVAGAQPRGAPRSGPGVPPQDAWTCPPTHPIKGNLTTRTGECIYHVRGGRFYEKRPPETTRDQPGRISILSFPPSAAT
jgi:hypothetical protein